MSTQEVERMSTGLLFAYGFITVLCLIFLGSLMGMVVAGFMRNGAAMFACAFVASISGAITCLTLNTIVEVEGESS